MTAPAGSPASPPARVLVVDDDASVGRILGATLRQEGFPAEVVKSGAEALIRLDRAAFDVVITDLRMPEMDGLALLAEVQRRWPDLPVVVITAHGSVQVAVEAMRAGAADFLTKPFEREEVAFVLGKALAREPRPEEASYPTSGLATGGLPPPGSPGARSRMEELLLGDSPSLRACRDLLAKAARTDATVLLRGESGTGKDVAARALHEASARAAGPFVKVHCGALPDALLESELFGHEKGAFTGAVGRKPGRVELAAGGTLFLDEIGDVTPLVQVKLLELLQDRAFFRVGGTSRVAAEVRIVAATHRDLEAMVADGSFREDLYYRLAVVPVVLPPLRERAGDVERLADTLVARIGAASSRPGARLTPAARARLGRESWPGNVRQLSNTIERLVVLGDHDLIEADDVERAIASSPTIRRPGGAIATSGPGEAGGAGGSGSSGGAQGGDLEERRSEAERGAIAEALAKSRGNKALAARLLGVSRRTLYNKLDALGLS